MKKGVFLAKKKNGDIYYRASFNFKGKHISLGSFDTEFVAHEVYKEATKVSKLNNFVYKLKHLPFEKYISIINYRDNNIYIKNPIYIRKNYFSYYLDNETELKFDVDDLFYYSTHKIAKREGYLYVADYGMQVNILSRYGIKNHAVLNRDYIHVNNDIYDYRYKNILVINRYYGVSKEEKKGRFVYVSRINIVGSVVIGRYSSEIDAAIAYNKAIDSLKSKGFTKNYTENYIEELSAIEYASRYNKVRISNRISNFMQ